MASAAMDVRLQAVEREAAITATRLSEHEKQCGERYEGLRREIKEQSRYIQRITSILLWVGGLLLSGMAGILVKLVFWPMGG